MYSNFFESSSKDCFPFGDQPTTYDMTEMNELTNQVNLDYIFDSYYSSVSHYNTGFELPEDCQNMSFSELFDQELFSTNDNKDCKLTIKIEKEEPLTQCYSAENSNDEVYNGNIIKNVENDIPLSINTPNLVNSKLGINRTAIKPDVNSSDVHSLLHNPFHETNLNSTENIPLKIEVSKIKCEVKTEPTEEIVEQNNNDMEINTYTLETENPSRFESSVEQDYWVEASTISQYTDDKMTCIIKDQIKNEIIPVDSTLKLSSTSDVKKEIISETEKKKISWEEFRAKRGKDLIKPIENNEEIDANATTDNHKLEAIKREFDRNTVEHFIGQKRKMEDIEKQKPHVKNLSDEEDELQKKRMKIEYIKKLLPSSFASEIAKTSSFLKGSRIENKEDYANSNNILVSHDKFQVKNDDPLHLKKEEKITKKVYQSRTYTSYLRNSSRSDYSSKNSRSSSIPSNPDEYYRSRVDVLLSGQYGQNMRNTNQRPKEQKRVVYVGQIPIKYGKRYLYNRFKEFGSIQSLTLHKKPDFRVYYAFVTYSEKAEAEKAINHGNDDQNQVQLDIRFGERKQTQTPYYDLDDEWLTDWYSYNQPPAVVRTQSPEQVTFEEELQEFYKLAQIKKLNQIKTPVS